MGILDAPAIQKETLGTKLRRLADAASKGHAWSRTYMKSVPPWQPSTAVIQSAVRVNGGNLYVCIVAGTTAASGGPTATDGGSHADGGAQWTYLGVNQVTSDPVTTQSAWVASTAYTLATQVINAGKVYGCVVAGTSASSGGPTTTTNAITDGTVTWTYMGPVQVNPYAQDFPTYSTAASFPGGLNNVYYPYALPGSVNAALVAAGGSGYVVGDTVTIGGGTFTTACVLTVTQVSSGAVKAVSVTTAGAYNGTLAAVPAVQGSTSGAGTGATFYLKYTLLPAYKVRGASVTGALGNHQTGVGTFQATPGAALTGQDCALEFYSDAPKLCIACPSGNSKVCVIIDDVRYNLDALDQSVVLWVFDFTTTGSRKKRLWRVELGAAAWLPYVLVDQTSQVWAPDDGNRLRAACISDSLFQGSAFGPFLGGNRVPFRIGHELGWNDVWDFSQGGTGYVNRGTAAGVTTDKYGARIAEALTTNPDIWVLMGSTNDIGQTGVQAAVTAAIQAIRSGGSTAPIFVFGLWSKNDAGLAAVEASVQAGVSGADTLAKTFFIPIYADPLLPWVTGSWNNNPAPSGLTQTTSANQSQYIAGDGTHPADLGSEYLARRLANALRSQFAAIK